MADVFAISIFIALSGPREMKDTSASLDPGFFYFTAYVLLSAVLTFFLIITQKIPPAFNS